MSDARWSVCKCGHAAKWHRVDDGVCCHNADCHCTYRPAVSVVEPQPAAPCGDNVCTNLGCTDACGLRAPLPVETKDKP